MTTLISPPALVTFQSVALADLEAMAADDRDALPFGVIGFSPTGEIDVYNATEGQMAGLRAERQLGLNLFLVVAPCMNNFLVAQRFEEEATLDDVVDYVLTLRMRPTKVKLRLLKQPGVARRYILIAR